jgi:hypothetical protein
MATATKSPAKRDIDGLERVGASLDEVQRVLESMRANVSSGAHDLFDDLERLVKDARRDLGGLTDSLRGDVDDLQQAIRRPPARKRPAPRAKSKAAAAK